MILGVDGSGAEKEEGLCRTKWLTTMPPKRRHGVSPAVVQNARCARILDNGGRTCAAAYEIPALRYGTSYNIVSNDNVPIKSHCLET
jgi:hypothetical protein